MSSDNQKRVDDFLEVHPKKSPSDESDFIASTFEKKESSAKPPKEPPEKKNDEDSEKHHFKHIKDVEHGIKKDIEVRKIIRSTVPGKGIIKTAELLKHGLHYFVEVEEFITKDFFFGWLPRKFKKYLKLIIPFALMLIILNLNLNVSPDIKKAMALFVVIASLWALESINMIVTALLIPVLAVILGLIKDTHYAFSSFSNPIIYLLLSGLILAQAFRKHELDKMIALRVIALSKGYVKRLLFFSMLIAALLGMWMSNTATIALLVPVIIMVSSEINHTAQKNYTSMLLLSTGFGAAIGAISTIIGSNPNAIAAAFIRNVSEFTFFDWVKIGFPISVILFTVAYFVFLKIYNVGNEKIPMITLAKEARKVKLNKAQRKILLIFIPTVFFWVFGSNLGVIFTTEIIGLSAAILLFVFKILEWDDVRRIPWEVFLLVGGGLTLGQILIDTGAAVVLADTLFSIKLIFPNFPNSIIIIVLVLTAIILANFVNNSSTTIILVPVILSLPEHMGINIKLLAMTAAMATAIAPLTPIAMPAFSIIYGTGQVSRREMIRTGMSIAMICGPILAALVYVMNRFLF